MEPPEQAKEATEDSMRTLEVNEPLSQRGKPVFEQKGTASTRRMSPEGSASTSRGTPKTERSTTTITTAPAPVPPLRNRRRRVTELRCGEVRWFYRRKDLDTKWIAFKGQDSIRLELRWRKDHDVEIDVQAEPHLEDIDKEVVVLDGLYRMSSDHSKITAVYWKDDEAELRRGSWFLPDGQPIQASMADSIEAHHLQYFRGQMIPEGTSMFSDKEASRKPQLTELQLPDNIEVKWSSVIDVFLYSTTKASRFLRYVAWGKDTKLRRGYEKEAEWEDGSPEVSHLILVVHGIGQKGYENLIAKNTEQIRDLINLVMDRQFPEEKSRPMLLPVEWRSQLVLDDGVTDQITLPKMASMRSTLNSTAMDIMYYQSPLYRKEIVGGVVKALNQVYTNFKRYNKGYTGPISIFAHSLGSVIAYDIVCHWSPLLMYDEYVANAIKEQLEDVSAEDSQAASQIRTLQEVREKLQHEMHGGIRSVLQSREEQLQFALTNLFCVGSPLGVFLVMRGAEAETIVPSTDLVGRIFNIFHPYDPVAYRLEPLFDAEMKNIRPVKIFSYSDARAKGDYDFVPPDVHKSYLKKKKQAERKGNKNGDKDEKGKGKKVKEPVAPEDELDEEDECDSDESGSNIRSACSSPRSLSPTREDNAPRTAEKNGFGGKSGGGGGWWFKSKEAENNNKKEKDGKKDEVERAKEAEAEARKLTEAERIMSSIPGERRPEKRIDFNVQPALTDKSYWSVLKSHFAYWTNPDLAMFLINIIYDQREMSRKTAEKEATEAAEKEMEKLEVTAIDGEGSEREAGGEEGGDNTDIEKVDPSVPNASLAMMEGVDTASEITVPSTASQFSTLNCSTPSTHDLLSSGCETPLSLLHLPKEEHLLPPDAPGRSPHI